MQVISSRWLSYISIYLGTVVLRETTLLDAMHLHLLQAGTALQSTYMRSSQSWGENDRLGWSLKEGASMAARLMACATTEGDTRRSLLLNMIHQEVDSRMIYVQSPKSCIPSF